MEKTKYDIEVLVRELRYYFDNVPLVMEAADVIEELLKQIGGITKMTADERYAKFDNARDLTAEFIRNIRDANDYEYMEDCEKAFEKHYERIVKSCEV